MVFIIKGFRTIVFIFIFISTTFRSICPLALSGVCRTYTELRTTSFNRVQALREPTPITVTLWVLFNPDCRQVTIQEYLTLVPGYG